MAVSDPEFDENRPDLADPTSGCRGGKETGPI